MILLGNNLVDLVLSAVFPRFCVACGAEGGLLCASCAASWWHEPPLATDGHVALFAYANPVVRKLICAWKYDYDVSAFTLLTAQARELLPELKTGMQALGIAAIVPIPLSSHRFRERGFNQSRMIADWLAGELSVPVLDVLSRSHRRGHQAERTDDERKLAMRNSPFLLKEGEGKLPEVVLLVDDVWTTGATMLAARRVIEAGGQTRAYGFTLASGGSMS